MKHNSGNRRPRSRGGKQRHGGGGRNNYESNGPGGKVRGTAQQVLDKYLGLARDAQSSGDRIGAEFFFQFAEHYFRVLNADSGNANQMRRDKQSQTPEEVVADDDMVGTKDAPVADKPTTEMDVAPAIDLADQPQPEVGDHLADMTPPVIEGAPTADANQAFAPKPRRRRRAKTERLTEEGESAPAS